MKEEIKKAWIEELRKENHPRIHHNFREECNGAVGYDPVGILFHVVLPRDFPEIPIVSDVEDEVFNKFTFDCYKHLGIVSTDFDSIICRTEKCKSNQSIADYIERVF